VLCIVLTLTYTYLATERLPRVSDAHQSLHIDQLHDVQKAAKLFCHKEFDTLKSATCHENLYCKKNNKKSKDNIIVCYKCGREGHYSNKCYASKHINGYFI
jgi:predicted GIY-YIG superfamily endonuclease